MVKIMATSFKRSHARTATLSAPSPAAGHHQHRPPPEQQPVVAVTGDGSKVRCCQEQYCIGTWNIRSMNQGELKVVKRDGKSECGHFRNQQTKMDWNG